MNWIEISKQKEGKLFEHISLLSYYDNSFTLCADYYTVKDGLVLLVNDGKEQYSGDTIETLVVDCIEIGQYDPNRVYPMKRKHYTHKEIKKLLQ
jgi:hypothetical protein